jgi:N utilization substance protein B
MSVPRQKFRELVLLLLYSNDIAGLSEEELLPLVMDTLKVTKKTVKEAKVKVEILLQKKDLLDAEIEKVSSSFTLDRIQKIEKSILRLAIFEMLFEEEIPQKVAICEAMRLARKFSTKEASLFVNALLDNLYKMRQGESIDKEGLMLAQKNFEESQDYAGEVAKEQASSIKENILGIDE